jgi:Zn-dependent protease with chaperone function
VKVAGDVLFNLLLNAVGSFWLGLVMALLVRRVSRGRAGVLAEFVLVLPFAKVVYDLGRGLPSSSFLWAWEHGARQRLGSFQIGFGATPLGPVLRGEIWAHHARGISPQSLPDLLSRALSSKVWLYAPAVVGFGLFAVSWLRLAQSVLSFARFQRDVSRIRAESQVVEERRLGFRRVRLYTTQCYQGVAFAGGLLRPYVVLPAAMLSRLSAEEREAVVQHELSHIAHWDSALLWPLHCLRELLWYVPGSGWLFTRVRTLLEFRADEAAVRAGVARHCIVSALLAVAELGLADPAPHVLGVSRGGRMLRERIERLLLPPPALRTPGKLATVARVLLVAWFVLGALQSVACGNHR